MLIRSTKKFFQKTIQSFKSLFNGTQYEKLPKTTPLHHFSTFSYSTIGDTDSVYQSNNYTNRWEWDSSSGNQDRGKSTKNTVSSPKTLETEVLQDADKNLAKLTRETVVKNNKKLQLHEGRRLNDHVRQEDYSYISYSKSIMDGRISLVAQKLKKLKMLDTSNAEHALDIQEVFHYYSRLTCPAYLEIVDKFFMEVYAEFSSSFGTPFRGYTSNLKQEPWGP